MEFAKACEFWWYYKFSWNVHQAKRWSFLSLFFFIGERSSSTLYLSHILWDSILLMHIQTIPKHLRGINAPCSYFQRISINCVAYNIPWANWVLIHTHMDNGYDMLHKFDLLKTFIRTDFTFHKLKSHFKRWTFFVFIVISTKLHETLFYNIIHL